MVAWHRIQGSSNFNAVRDAGLPASQQRRQEDGMDDRIL
jgi:hypothetical protein